MESCHNYSGAETKPLPVALSQFECVVVIFQPRTLLPFWRIIL